MVAVDGVSLAIAEGELLALVGPSGCGKTTTCKMIAGLEAITDGEVRIHGRVVNRLPPEQRNIAMVFEDYALYPRMNVYDNVAFPLRVRNTPRAELHQKVTDMLEKTELLDVADTAVHDLSGGQQQRVSIARALVRQPALLIMDEPLSHLDVGLKGRLRTEIRVLQQQLGLTAVLVTHDQSEAMAMADRIAVMHHGELRQCAPPHVIYDQPVDTFVAGFIGEPPMNFLPGDLVVDASGSRFVSQDLAFEVSDEVSQSLQTAGVERGRHEVIAGIRPEHLAIVDGPQSAHAVGTVRYSEWVGDFQSVTLSRPAGDEPWLVVLADANHRFEPGDRSGIVVDPARVSLFDAHTERNLLACGTSAPEPQLVAG
ncbi:hypothetical protein ASJ79_07285 [Mycobacterium sp. NAZ190054]|nr:hypothetical protein ASJ79_07285 [Mycobacterium sp. NAZ190054]